MMQSQSSVPVSQVRRTNQQVFPPLLRSLLPPSSPPQAQQRSIAAHCAANFTFQLQSSDAAASNASCLGEDDANEESPLWLKVTSHAGASSNVSGACSMASELPLNASLRRIGERSQAVMAILCCKEPQQNDTACEDVVEASWAFVLIA